jgi:hypothetical protein
MRDSVIREVSGIEATEPVDMGAEPPCRNPPAISAESAGRMWGVLPALPAGFCGGAGVGSVAWVPA